MSNFLYLFRGGDEHFNTFSQEEKQAHMEVWGAWMGGLAEKGKLVDGFPLDAKGTVVKNRGEIMTNGPFAEGEEIVGGYVIVSADSFEEAVEISKGCPIFDYKGSTLEVREIMSMDM